MGYVVVYIGSSVVVYIGSSVVVCIYLLCSRLHLKTILFLNVVVYIHLLLYTFTWDPALNTFTSHLTEYVYIWSSVIVYIGPGCIRLHAPWGCKRLHLKIILFLNVNVYIFARTLPCMYTFTSGAGCIRLHHYLYVYVYTGAGRVYVYIGLAHVYVYI